MPAPPVPAEAVEAAMRAWMHAMGCCDCDCRCGELPDDLGDDEPMRAALEAAAPVLREHWTAASHAAAVRQFRQFERERRKADRLGKRVSEAGARVAELEALADEILAAFRPRRDRAGHRASTRRDVVDRWRVTLAGTP